MRPGNHSSVSEFLLLGIPVPLEQQGMLFALFLGMYLTTVLGNLLIILLIRLDSRLHTPMYFFLSHLALSDVSFASVTVPKMLINIQTQEQSIPYAGCVTQMYFFIFFGCIDNLLLAVMAYDRYVAICHPLHYTTIMRGELCVFLLAGSWLLACASALSHTLLLAQLSFCADNTIPHFFCDLAALLKLSCSDTSLNEIFIFAVGGLVIFLSFIGVLVSYGHIGAAILRFPSIKGICKALSTCGSHLSVVFLFYGTIMVLYFFPSSSNSNDKDIIASVIKERKGMTRHNQSSVSEFLLLGLPIWMENQGIFYALFLGMYLTTVLGNLLIMLLIRLDSCLHTPMYFFLSHLALSDVSFASVTVPKMLMNMQSQSQSISYAGCISQVYFFLFFGDLDSFLLTSMAYDRYVAICHPLHYTTIMSQSLCFLLVVVSWVLSCASALLHTLLLARLSFYGGNSLPHFFCDLSALLKLSSSDTTVNERVIMTVGVVVITLPFICILVSYGHIGATILRVPSTRGICKALSTCSSHLSVVSLYYGAIIGLYFFPSSSNSDDKDVIVAVLYTLVTPMLNPFIYSLRNRDMKGALENMFSRGIFSP
ncbi:Olfactory Receptor 1J2 [Manis pentadactyla]|nr:Olfactory Receptor 1J2 [Manis pentadactyla]